MEKQTVKQTFIYIAIVLVTSWTWYTYNLTNEVVEKTREANLAHNDLVTCQGEVNTLQAAQLKDSTLPQ